MKFLNLKMIAILGAIIFIILDIFIKNFFSLNPEKEIKIFSWFSLRQELNYGVAFSLPFPRLPLLVLTGFLLTVIVFYFVYCLKNKKIWSGIFSFFILLGGANNYFDRMFKGFSRDQFDLNGIIVNLSDVLIFFGVVGLFFIQAEFFKRRN